MYGLRIKLKIFKRFTIYLVNQNDFIKCSFQRLIMVL